MKCPSCPENNRPKNIGVVGTVTSPQMTLESKIKACLTLSHMLLHMGMTNGTL